MDTDRYAGEHKGLRLVQVRSPRGNKTYRLPERYVGGSINQCVLSLAHAGWSRAEISNTTGIRYQHVRNILEQGGPGGASGGGGSGGGGSGPNAPATPAHDLSVEQGRIGSVVAFADLVARVEAGEEIAVTREGVPVARIVPFAPNRDADAIRAALAGMDAIRRRTDLTGLRIKGLIDEGRS